MNRETKKGETKMTKTLKEMIEFVTTTKATYRQKNFYRVEAIWYLRDYLSNYKSVVDAWEDIPEGKYIWLAKGSYEYMDCLFHEWARKENPEYCEGMKIIEYPVPSKNERDEWFQEHR